MKLVAQVVQTREVPVLDILLDEAKKWNFVLELRMPHPDPPPEQRRVVAKGKPGLWWRLGPEMHSDTPDQEEPNEHPSQRLASSSATRPV